MKTRNLIVIALTLIIMALLIAAIKLKTIEATDLANQRAFQLSAGELNLRAFVMTNSLPKPSPTPPRQNPEHYKL